MSKLILFSEPKVEVLNKLATHLFSKNIKKIAYIPSDGNSPNNPSYEKFWRDYVENHGAELLFIDNSISNKEIDIQRQRIEESDALILTGGNTFRFLKLLRDSGLFEVVAEYLRTDKMVVGFSAGAILMSPTIEIAELPSLDLNEVGLKDLSSFGAVDFDIYPHYTKEAESSIRQYEESTKRKVKRLSDDDIIVV